MTIKKRAVIGITLAILVSVLFSVSVFAYSASQDSLGEITLALYNDDSVSSYKSPRATYIYDSYTLYRFLQMPYEDYDLGSVSFPQFLSDKNVYNAVKVRLQYDFYFSIFEGDTLLPPSTSTLTVGYQGVSDFYSYELESEVFTAKYIETIDNPASNDSTELLAHYEIISVFDFTEADNFFKSNYTDFSNEDLVCKGFKIFTPVWGSATMYIGVSPSVQVYMYTDTDVVVSSVDEVTGAVNDLKNDINNNFIVQNEFLNDILEAAENHTGEVEDLLEGMTDRPVPNIDNEKDSADSAIDDAQGLEDSLHSSIDKDSVGGSINEGGNAFDDFFTSSEYTSAFDIVSRCFGQMISLKGVSIIICIGLSLYVVGILINHNFFHTVGNSKGGNSKGGNSKGG